MLGGKLLQIIKKMDRKEMTRFAEFVHSPFFNKHEKVQTLVDLLAGQFPRFGEDHFDPEEVFAHVYPGEVFEKNKLAVVFTYTQRLLEEFLSIEQFKCKGNWKSILFLEDLRQRKIYPLYEKQMKKVAKDIENQTLSNQIHLFDYYLLSAEKYEYYDSIEKRQKDFSFQEKQNALDYYYLSEKFKDACEKQVRSKILNVNYRSRLMEAAVEEVERHQEEYRQIPGIFMYYRFYLMLSRENEEQYYFDSYQFLSRNEDGFGRTELIQLYNYLQNYCIEKINEGQPQFLNEIFKLYKSQLQNGLLIEDGYLSEWHYKNIVTTAIRLGEMDWVRGFIEEFKKHLHPESEENAYRFNLASYYHASGQYDQVLELLTRVEYSDQRYNLGAKALLLRTYYEIDELDPLISLTDSFRQYLLRNKLMSDGMRKGYYNLFKLTKRCALIRTNRSFYSAERYLKEVKQLERAFQNTPAIFNRSWLEGKLQDLIKKTEKKKGVSSQ